MKLRLFLWMFFLLSICLITTKPVIAQNLDENKTILRPDSTTLILNDSTLVEVQDSTTKKRPPVDKKKIRRAALASALVPGLGQAFNKQIYKTPIYPGAMALSISTGFGNRSKYNKYTDSLTMASTLFGGGDSIRNRLRTKQNNARVISNNAFALAGFMYAANIIDAYVSAQIKERTKNATYSPLLAAYRSAALPGLGQITNKQYWKVPIFWLLLSGTGVSAVYWHNKMQCHSNIYLNRVSYNFFDEALWESCVYNSNSTLSDANLLAYRQRYKRNFELSLIAMGLAYVLNIADALVYSHLNNFDMDDSLSLNIKPVLIPLSAGENYLGINLKLSL